MLKNVPITTKPQVVIDLPPILEAFLRFATETPPDQKEITVSRKTDFGLLINGVLSKSHSIPEDQSSIENPVFIIVPRTEKNWYSLEINYIYISKEHHEQIRDIFEVLFNQWLYIFFEDAYTIFHLSQLEIIKSILSILNVRFNAVNFEYIKKRDYRKGQSRLRLLSMSILRQRKTGIYKHEKYFSDFE